MLVEYTPYVVLLPSSFLSRLECRIWRDIPLASVQQKERCGCAVERTDNLSMATAPASYGKFIGLAFAFFAPGMSPLRPRIPHHSGLGSLALGDNRIDGPLSSSLQERHEGTTAESMVLQRVWSWQRSARARRLHCAVYQATGKLRVASIPFSTSRSR